MLFTLRDYQVDAIAGVEAAEARGVRRQLVVAPTGTGKTCVFCALIQSRPGRALVLVHRDELVRQTVAKLTMIAPELSLGVVKAERNEVDADVVVASIQTVSRPNRLAWLLAGGPEFSTVIVDEAHHSTADSYRAVLDGLGSFREGGPLTVGFTATPDRGDGHGLDDVYQEIVHSYGLITAIARGHLVNLRGELVGTSLDLTKVRTRGGDLLDSDLGTALEESDALEHIATAVIEASTDRPRKGLAFLPTVKTAHLLADVLCARGITAEALDGTTPIDERRAILSRLHTGETTFVTNCAVLVEGFDESSIDLVVIARPTQSRPFYTQMVGRGTRLHPGKTECLVLDIVGATGRHSLVTLPTLAGLKRTGAKGESLVEMAAEAETDAGSSKRLMSVATGRGAVDLFRSKLRWLEIDDGYCLPAGQSTVVLAPTGEDTWTVLSVERSRTVELAAGLNIGYAQGVGEDHITSTGAHTLARRNSRWLKLPPTEPQLNYLRQQGLRDPSRVRTRGEAADLITRLAARRAIRRLQKASA